MSYGHVGPFWTKTGAGIQGERIMENMKIEEEARSFEKVQKRLRPVREIPDVDLRHQHMAVVINEAKVAGEITPSVQQQFFVRNKINPDYMK